MFFPEATMKTAFTYTIMQNIMKMFHRAMKIRKYRRLSRNSLMLSPRIQTDVTVLYGRSLLDCLSSRMQPHLLSVVWTHLQTRETPFVGYKTLVVNDSCHFVMASSLLFRCIQWLHWKNTHSLKFSTAPAFTSKVLQNTDTKLMRANCVI